MGRGNRPGGKRKRLESSHVNSNPATIPPFSLSELAGGPTVWVAVATARLPDLGAVELPKLLGGFSARSMELTHAKHVLTFESVADAQTVVEFLNKQQPFTARFLPSLPSKHLLSAQSISTDEGVLTINGKEGDASILVKPAAPSYSIPNAHRADEFLSRPVNRPFVPWAEQMI